MTWFRVGGAGIPASLKNAMNAVLNKKFGTSGQNYPPKGWPDDVNLLGPLPEKTVSGAIVNFSDGADTVPLKDLIFSASPIQASGTPSPTNPLPISGHTSLTGVHCGKNLVNYVGSSTLMTSSALKTAIDPSINWLNSYLKGGDTISVSAEIELDPDISINNAFLSLAVLYSDNTRTNIILVNNSTVIGSNGATLSNGKTVTNVFISYNVAYKLSLKNLQIELNSSPTTYSPYSAESKKWEFGQTIYSGQVNALTGEVESKGKTVDLGTLTWNIDSNRTGVFYANAISDAVTDNCAMLCSAYKVDNEKNPNTISDYELCSRSSYGGKRVFIKNTDYSGYTGAQVATALSGTILLYELATPISIDMDSVDWQSKYADNNFYNDCGDTSVTYRQDIALALAALQGSRSLSASLMRSGGPEEITEDTEEVREPEENIQNTEEQEGDNDAR